MNPHLRIARPSSNPAVLAALYCQALGWQRLGGFEDHVGFDGVMVGPPGGAFHLELTVHRGHPVAPAPTPEDLLVLYLPDPGEWAAACERVVAAGFRGVASFNPYWDDRGRTFAGPDGYRLVLQNDAWLPDR